MVGLSKRTLLGKNYRSDVHFVRPFVDDIQMIPSIRIYHVDGFLRVHAGKNLSARTQVASARTRDCVRTDTVPPSPPPRPLARSFPHIHADAQKKIKKLKIILFYFIARQKKEKKKLWFSVFNPQDRGDPEFPKLRRQSRDKKKFFST
jgi:hypothetical protein